MASDRPLDIFIPLAELALGDSGKKKWVKPLAILLEAVSGGLGQKSIAEVFEKVDPQKAPAHLFTLEGDRVMLPRIASSWHTLRDFVENALKEDRLECDDLEIKKELNRILPLEELLDSKGQVSFPNAEQRLATAALVDAKVGVLTGGPGTGKTTSIAALLALRKCLDKNLKAERVLLCAPTGKAANRLKVSLFRAVKKLKLNKNEIDFLTSIETITLHRGLGWSVKKPEEGGPFLRNARNPLDKDLILVDEVSMVDVELMAHLIRALPEKASVLFIGDRDQLESVEAGGVLAELVKRGASGGLSKPLKTKLDQRLETCSQTLWKQGFSENPKSPNPLRDLSFALKHSWRAHDAPWILDLASIVRPGSRGSAEQFLECCKIHSQKNKIHRHEKRKSLEDLCVLHWKEMQKKSSGWSFKKMPSEDELSEWLGQFQLICGTNAQVHRANEMGLNLAWGEEHVGGLESFPHGCPVLIQSNHRALNLANGDVGILLGAGSGQCANVACFPGMNSPIPISQLPDHIAAFGMTIHKSQGSEWSRMAIDLPDDAAELLDRNLFYTAITRSSQSLDLFVRDSVLNKILS